MIIFFDLFYLFIFIYLFFCVFHGRRKRLIIIKIMNILFEKLATFRKISQKRRKRTSEMWTETAHIPFLSPIPSLTQEILASDLVNERRHFHLRGRQS